MGARRQPRAVPLPPAPCAEQGLHPMPVRPVRLEQRLQGGVVQVVSDQGVTDLVGNVVIAEADRVGVAMG